MLEIMYIGNKQLASNKKLKHFNRSFEKAITYKLQYIAIFKISNEIFKLYWPPVPPSYITGLMASQLDTQLMQLTRNIGLKVLW